MPLAAAVTAPMTTDNPHLDPEYKRQLEQYTTAQSGGKEYKLRPLGEFKMLNDAPGDEGPGGIAGYDSVFGELDDVGDIVVAGAYKGCLDEFLEKGFAAHSHNWDYDGVIGYFTVAKEDAKGLYTETVFHSTPDAQDMRTKVKERIAAGKTVSKSIGYAIEDCVILLPRDYATELKKYVPAAQLATTLEKARQFTRIRVLTQVKLFETSIVTVPALQSAAVGEAKNHHHPPNHPEGHPMPQATTEFKAQYLGDYIEKSMTMAAISRLCDALMYNVLYDVVCEDEIPLAQRLDMLRAACDEFRDILTSTIAALLADAETEESDEAKTARIEQLSAEIKSLFCDPADQDGHVSLRAGLTLQKRFDAVLAANQKLIADAKSIREMRKKEGRTLSGATQERIKSQAASIRTVADDMDLLLSECTPDAEGKNAHEGKGAADAMADEAAVAAAFSRYVEITHSL